MKQLLIAGGAILVAYGIYSMYASKKTGSGCGCSSKGGVTGTGLKTSTDYTKAPESTPLNNTDSFAASTVRTFDADELSTVVKPITTIHVVTDDPQSVVYN